MEGKKFFIIFLAVNTLLEIFSVPFALDPTQFFINLVTVSLSGIVLGAKLGALSQVPRVVIALLLFKWELVGALESFPPIVCSYIVGMLAERVDEKRSMSDKSHLVKRLILSSSVGAVVYFALDLAGIVLSFFLILQMLGKSAFDLDIALTVVTRFSQELLPPMLLAVPITTFLGWAYCARLARVVPSESLEKALFKAVKDGDAVKVGELLGKGASANPRDAIGWTPLHNAAVMGRTDIAMLLLEKGADVNARSSVGLTPLHLAAAEGRAETVRLLLEKGADAGAVDNRGWTPLHYAAFAGYVNIAALLIGWRANVNARDKDGITPLHVAAARGHSGVVELLVKSGADVNARSYSGRTPLHVAAGNGHVEVVRLLLESGADPSVRSLDGKTPLDLARESKRVDVVRCIEEFARFRIERARALYEELVALRGEIEKYRGYLSKLEALHAEGNISDDAYQQLKREYMEKLKELERKMEALEKERRSEASRTHGALD
jgi:ankyrin repeat protein/biotin transporter BioY